TGKWHTGRHADAADFACRPWRHGRARKSKKPGPDCGRRCCGLCARAGCARRLGRAEEQWGGDAFVKILTGNDLSSGDVIWWAGDGWSRHVGESVDVGDKGDELARSEEAALRVVGAYVIDATVTDEGVRPAHIKDRIRALG